MALAHCSTLRTTDRTRRDYLRANAARLGPPPRPVVVIAGFGVTRLVDPVTGHHVWGTPRSVWSTHHPDDLDLDASDRLIPAGWVGSRGPINTGWQLAIGLRKFGGYRESDVHPFYYDWRKSARDNARLLARHVDAITSTQVDLVTHSAGALVALEYARTSSRVANLVMVAPAQRGTLEAWRVFIRPERFVRRTFTPEMVATWPFVFELLPDDGRVFVDESGKLLERDLWDPQSWPFDVRRRLEEARAFRDELRRATISAKVTVIAGDCIPTAIRVLTRSDGTHALYPEDLRRGEDHLTAVLFEPGDGTVPVSSASERAEPLLFCDGHQGIAADPSVHRAMIRALRE